MSIVRKQPPEELKNISPAKLQLRKPQQKKLNTYSQNLFKHLNQLKQKNAEIASTDVQNIYKIIQRSKTLISQAQMIAAVKYLMSILYKNNYPQKQILYNPYIKKLEKYQKFIQLQNLLYVINKQLSKIKPIEKEKQNQGKLNQKQSKQNLDGNNSNQKSGLNLVNNLYLYCFQKFLPSFQQQNSSEQNSQLQHEKIKCQAILYKNFGKYIIQYGGIQNKQKGSISINKSIYKHQELIANQFHRMEKFVKKCEEEATKGLNATGQKKSKIQKQRQQLQINALKQNVRRLIQSMFQTLHYYYLIEKAEIKSLAATASKSKQLQKKTQQKILQLLAIINQTMKYKSMVPGIHIYSRYYHRLMQIFYQLQYTFALLKKNVERVKQLRMLMRQFIKQSINDIEQCQRLEIQKQITQAIFAIQLHLSRISSKNSSNNKISNSNQQIKKQLSDCAFKIIKAGKMQENKIAKQVITKLLAEFIKKNIH